MTITEILEHAKTLSKHERKELLKALIDTLGDAPEEQRSILELRGLGKEIWQGIDAQEYVDQLRNEWDERP